MYVDVREYKIDALGGDINGRQVIIMRRTACK